MKLLAIFRYELTYQLRGLLIWLYFAALGTVAFLFVRGNFLADALYADFYLNSPFVVAVVTVFCSLFSLLVTSAVTGEAAARDVVTGMHPLLYAAPVRKAEYLGGRLLAAFALNGLVVLAVPAGVLVAVYAPGAEAARIGPFRPAMYLTAYGFLALPNAFIGTAIQFAWATLGRRVIASYLGSVLLLVLAYGGIFLIMYFLERPEVAVLLDFFAQLTVLDMTLKWAPSEKSTRLIELRGALLQGRLLWLGVGLGALALTYARFRFAHPTLRPWRLLPRLLRRRRAAPAPPPVSSLGAARPAMVPWIARRFAFTTYARQTLVIAGTAFRALAWSPAGLPLLAAIAALAVVLVPEKMVNLDTPLLPRTEYVLTFLTAPLTSFATPWVVIPLLIIFYAGELIWREREAGLGEITDAAPVPEWGFFLGRLLAIGLLLGAWLVLLTGAGIAIQLQLGYHRYELGLYLRVLFGLQLPEYLLFAVLGLAVQGVIRQKYVGLFAALLAYAFILFAPQLGVGPRLLVYGSAPGWRYTEMRGFGTSLGPWNWFMAYWAAWALLLAVGAKLLWVRELEGRLGARLQLARRRCTRPTAVVAAAAGGLVVALGGFIFYNTHVLNDYAGSFERNAQRAEYERRYARYAHAPQPRLTAADLRVELYPKQPKVAVRGTYQLVNRTGAVIDSIHLATIGGVRTSGVAFDRPAACVLADEVRGHRIYALREPLQPGDSLRLRFVVRAQPRGFGNGGISRALAANGTFFRSSALLPAIGYQPERELLKPGERRAHHLPARSLFPTLAEADGNRDITDEDSDGSRAGRVTFRAVVGTAADQIAVAPGALRRTWTSGDRRYFQFAADAPIGTEWSFFSARYAVREAQWRPPAGPGRPVTIRVYYHPRHGANLNRMLRSVRASLTGYSRAFGPYPYGHFTLVQNPGSGTGAHAAAAMVDYTEGFTRFNPAADPRGLDLPFAIIAHEMGHQWWGAQLPRAYAEGAPLLSESAAWYSALGVVEATYGRAHQRRLLRFFRQPDPIPFIRQSAPLLQAMDPYAAYRKGPFALYTMSEYIGKERVDRAFRRLLEKATSGELPAATSLDLYRELQAVTPDSAKPLLHDLFAANTLWQLSTEQATARPTPAGAWQVTLRLKAHKLIVSPTGAETELPMDEWVPIGVFGSTTEQSADFGPTLYLQRHRIRTGEQTLTLTVPRKPADAGIDPYHLLIEEERFDNVERVTLEKAARKIRSGL